MWRLLLYHIGTVTEFCIQKANMRLGASAWRCSPLFYHNLWDEDGTMMWYGCLYSFCIRTFKFQSQFSYLLPYLMPPSQSPPQSSPIRNHFYLFKHEWECQNLSDQFSYSLIQRTRWASQAWSQLSHTEKAEYRQRFWQLNQSHPNTSTTTQEKRPHRRRKNLKPSWTHDYPPPAPNISQDASFVCCCHWRMINDDLCLLVFISMTLMIWIHSSTPLLTSSMHQFLCLITPHHQCSMYIYCFLYYSYLIFQ